MLRILLSLYLILSCLEGYSYNKPPSFSEEAWLDAQPYLLPMNHPLKAKLDKLFKTHITQNSASLKKAGFEQSKARNWSHTIVSKNDKLKGYYFKLFTDDQRNIDSYGILKKRIIGAKRLQHAIDRHGHQKLFKVPLKWLYLIPNYSSPNYFILIAEDCHLISSEGNLARWKNVNDPNLLTVLYTLIKEEGLSDSIYPINLPFNMSGQICFIDTEHNQEWPVRFEKLTPFFSTKMQKHWVSLIQAP